MDRRDVLRTMGAAASAALLVRPSKARAAPAQARDPDPPAVLVDTTKCIGCRTCERTCAKVNGLPAPDRQVDWSVRRETSPAQWTVVNRYEPGGKRVTVKTQCMHCLQPACATACLTRAMYKTPEGPVVWREDRCMGCRFCLVSCPFDVPKFEYDKAVPKIQKCFMCWARLAEGEEPACVKSCPVKALRFGRRSEMLDEARRRIYADPDRYVNHVYGEHEAGGTSWLYLASVPFEELGFRTDVGETPYPTYTREFLHAVPFVVTLLPPFLLALSAATNRAENAETED